MGAPGSSLAGSVLFAGEHLVYASILGAGHALRQCAFVILRGHAATHEGLSGQAAMPGIGAASKADTTGSGVAAATAALLLFSAVNVAGESGDLCLGGVEQVFPLPVSGMASAHGSAASAVMLAGTGHGAGIADAPVPGPILDRAEVMGSAGATRHVLLGGVAQCPSPCGHGCASWACPVQERTMTAALVVLAVAKSQLSCRLDLSVRITPGSLAQGACSGFPMYQGAGVRVDFRAPGSFPEISFKEVFA